jgi:putative membrane protein insertion efficiency factor
MRAALTAGRAGPARPRDPGAVARAALVVLRGYKLLVSPLFTGSCRFSPSCSTYMAQAIREHGALRGGWLGVRRVLRCHPFGGHGFDPVPPPRA